MYEHRDGIKSDPLPRVGLSRSFDTVAIRAMQPAAPHRSMVEQIFRTAHRPALYLFEPGKPS
jgi:hypothetical protein